MSALVRQYLEKQAASHGACAKDTKSDFSIACIEPKQPYFAYDNEVLCEIAENMQVDLVQSRQACFV